MNVDFVAIKAAAEGYKADMSKFLRDMIAIPSESCDEEKVVKRNIPKKKPILCVPGFLANCPAPAWRRLANCAAAVPSLKRWKYSSVTAATSLPYSTGKRW